MWVYFVMDAMVGGGKWYLRCFRFFCFFKYMYEVLGGLCEWVEVWKKFLFSCLHFERISDFYLVRCFVLDMWWWLIFVETKKAFFMFCCRQVLVLVSPRWLWERCLCIYPFIILLHKYHLWGPWYTILTLFSMDWIYNNIYLFIIIIIIIARS